MHPSRLRVTVWHLAPTQSQQPCRHGPRAANRFTHRDRHTVLSWPKFQPLFERIASNRGDRDKYAQLTLDDIKIDI